MEERIINNVEVGEQIMFSDSVREVVSIENPSLDMPGESVKVTFAEPSGYVFEIPSGLMVLIWQ